jgi:hypothetical protein
MAAVATKYDLCPESIEPSKIFRGTKLAQRGPGNIEIIDLLTRSAHPHNLKVIGSNPIPATKLSPLDQSVSSALAGFFMSSVLYL